MKITLNIDNINYESIIDRFIPFLKGRAETDNNVLLKTIVAILNMPGDLPKKTLNALPQEMKDELVIYIINKNKERISVFMQDALANKGFELKISDLEIEK